ncbi:DUF2827 family protein [Paraburkholderia sp. WSM4177]|uniref:DUF2827 family protein n=1 Tax=Paraburkholderia sp. WSM4177 TaxID=2723098 RepID=UPI0016159BFF|nr:DUF2827 family protein [Paraburkholderia sp. WSM4177]
MRIGISVVTRAGQDIWQNGLGQNVIFLAELFQRLPFVNSVVLIDVGDQFAMSPQVDTNAKAPRVMATAEATDQVDVIVEMGGADRASAAVVVARGARARCRCENRIANVSRRIRSSLPP